MTRRLKPFDARTRRHTLRFGDLEAPLADADLAQLHDALTRLHSFPDASVRRLRAALRESLERDAGEEHVLDLGLEEARQVQLAVYCDQLARKPTSEALADARVQAFRFIENRAATS